MTETVSPSDLGARWRFHLGEAAGADKPEHPDSEWEIVDLPHSFNADDTFIQKRGYYRGPAWYRKRFPSPAGDGPAFLTFDAVWGRAQLWLNGEYLGEHLEGLTGFQLDITDGLFRGANVLSVRVDNSHDPRILPGKPIPDYNIYGGLCGDVWLVRKRRAHFPWRSCVITTPSVDRERAAVDMVIGLSADPGMRDRLRASVTVKERGGKDVFSTGRIGPSLGDYFTFHGEIPSPALWSTSTPFMYEAAFSLYLGGSLLDVHRQRFGIRSYSFDPSKGFILNGERVQLRGVNRHQDFPGLGNVLPERLHRRDVELIKELGANFVRTSHYPQSPAFLDACDELGVLVYEEITSWQFIGGREFLDSADAAMSGMIDRDRNHPCVVLWGMMNEGRSRRLLERLKQTALKHDPTRPTIYADNRLSDGVFLGTVFICDVLGINYKLETIDAFHSAYPQIRILVSEHTNADSALRGRGDLERSQAERIAKDLDIIEARPYISGSTLWSMHDYGTDYEPVWPIQRSGILDEFRNPKEAFHMLAARWSRDPVIHIASDWSLPHREGEEVEVRVYTNCDTVELYLDARSLGTRKGFNPVVWKVPHTATRIRAIGRRGDSQTVTESVAVPGKAARVDITGPEEMLADGKDAACFVARITDKDGNTVPDFRQPILFECKGPVRLCGPGRSPLAMPSAGIASIAVRSTRRRGNASLTASADGIATGSISFPCR